MHQGESSSSASSSSAGKRMGDEGPSGSEVPPPPRRRGPRRGSRGAREEVEREPEIVVEEVNPLDMVLTLEGRVPRPSRPHGPHLGAGFAAGWTGSNLVLDPASHISQRMMRGKKLGYMRTFSGYSSVFWAYEHVLSGESRAILSNCAFGSLISHWFTISKTNVSANLMLLRAFLDRYWDTTNTFHLPGFEAGITFSSFGIVSGLPCGPVPIDWGIRPPNVGEAEVLAKIGDVLNVIPNRSPFLIRTVCIYEYFQGKGKSPPDEGDDEQNARLWLWWFLGSTFLGDKGERVSTSTLYYLYDLSRLGEFDWVTPALGLTIKYWRDAVRPDKMDEGSQPSLVFPGIIMESWVLTHFPFLLPAGFVRPFTYPAVLGWATCVRSRWGLGYDMVRKKLNEMTINDFDPRPWVRCQGVPKEWLGRMVQRDPARLYLTTPFDDFWYLGERLALQTQTFRRRPVVPVDPPLCLFVQIPDPVARRGQFREGESVSLLLPDADYTAFACNRLACDPIEAIDPDMEHQPPDFPETVEYEDQGVRHTYALPPPFPMETDCGMDSWVSKVKKVAGGNHKKLWRTANRWRVAAARLSMELCQYRRETAALRQEYKEYRVAHGG